MKTTDMNALAGLSAAVAADPGLPANISASDIAGGVAAANLMNGVLIEAINATGVNEDGRITEADLYKVSSYIRADAALYAAFVEGHGNDEGKVETGFHLVQGDGGALEFQGRRFVDTVADAIYHFGFMIVDGRFQNEDGNANEQVADVAGWLNYFLNGGNAVYGSSKSETLYSGDYSFAFADAASERFDAGGGNDSIWAGDGDDIIYGRTGNDVSAGDAGNDKMYGGKGNDKLWGGDGNDDIHGGDGNDVLGGGTGDDDLRGFAGADTLAGQEGDDILRGGSGGDVMWGQEGNDLFFGSGGNDKMGGGDGADRAYGGAGGDTIWGDDGDDVLSGRSGNDQIAGGDGDDNVMGGTGNDTLTGGNGEDMFRGGKGKDTLQDWEDTDAVDTFYFRPGETGMGEGADVIAGFTSGIDIIELAGYGGPDFIGEGAFSGSGSAEVRVSKHMVHIDVNGDGTADEEISVLWVGILSESDFSFWA